MLPPSADILNHCIAALSSFAQPCPLIYSRPRAAVDKDSIHKQTCTDPIIFTSTCERCITVLLRNCYRCFSIVSAVMRNKLLTGIMQICTAKDANSLSLVFHAVNGKLLMYLMFALTKAPYRTETSRT